MALGKTSSSLTHLAQTRRTTMMARRLARRLARPRATGQFLRLLRPVHRLLAPGPA